MAEKRKPKIHLYRSSRSTWCGKVVDNTGSPLNKDGTVPSKRVQRDSAAVTCKTCIKADQAEARKQS